MQCREEGGGGRIPHTPPALTYPACPGRPPTPFPLLPSYAPTSAYPACVCTAPPLLPSTPYALPPLPQVCPHRISRVLRRHGQGNHMGGPCDPAGSSRCKGGGGFCVTEETVPAVENGHCLCIYRPCLPPFPSPPLSLLPDAYGLQIMVLTSFKEQPTIKISPANNAPTCSQRVLWLSFWAEVRG